MRAVDMELHRVVCRGIPWPSDCAPPSAKDMLARLERNEALVSWLQPIGGGIEDQFPAIQVGAVFYTISLRMMKAVWRHVRLKRGFVNREIVPHVGVRLRIPTLLLCEKIRTQQRFNMMRVKQRIEAGAASGGGGMEGGCDINKNDDAGGKRRRKDDAAGGFNNSSNSRAAESGEGGASKAQLATAASGGGGGGGNGSNNGNFRDMLWVVENWIVTAEPAAACAKQASGGGGGGGGDSNHNDNGRPAAWAGFTRFRLDETELFENLMYQMRRDCPRLCSELAVPSSSSSSSFSPCFTD